MTIDLFLLSMVLFFAVLGAFTGAARQVANLIALGVAYFCAGPLGKVLAPRLADSLGLSLVTANVAAHVLVFGVVLLALRAVLTQLFRRMLSGQEGENRALDRGLGFALGGLRMALFAYLFLSAMTFLERNVSVAGRRFSLPKTESRAVTFSRDYNLFELTQFAPVRDLVQLVQDAQDPLKARQLKSDPAYQALRKDSRFQDAMKDKELREALERGDTRAALRNERILQLIQDPDAAAQMGAAARSSKPKSARK